MKNTVYIATAALAAVVVASSAQAQEAAIDRDSQIQQIFEDLDQNRDRQIDAAEARELPSLQTAFGRLAPDGSMDRAQFAKWYRQYDQDPASE